MNMKTEMNTMKTTTKSNTTEPRAVRLRDGRLCRRDIRTVLADINAIMTTSPGLLREADVDEIDRVHDALCAAWGVLDDVQYECDDAGWSAVNRRK